jgi:hypothetical protein
MQIPRDPDDPGQILLRFDAGRILVLFNRADYWQCGLSSPRAALTRSSGVAW